MKITLDITAQDFDYLTTNSMEWAGNDWKSKEGRFEELTHDRCLCTGPSPLIHDMCSGISYAWAYAFWVTTYADYMLAVAYLKSIAEPHQAAFDGADSDIVILTDFAGSWGK